MKKIGIIGYGNMGSAIAERVKIKYSVSVFDKDKAKTKNAKGIKVKNSIIDLVNRSEVIILAVKPQDFNDVLREIKNLIKDQLIISIAAGVSTKYIQKILGKGRIIRTMPNLPAQIGKGTIGICRSSSAKKKDLIFTKQLFARLGTVIIVDEKEINKVTAASGSGPGFFARLIELEKIDSSDHEKVVAFITNIIPSYFRAVEKLGLDKHKARLLATSTGVGTADYLHTSGLTAEELRKKVSSKKGTTEAGLKKLRGVATLLETLKAAVKRAKELSKG